MAISKDDKIFLDWQNLCRRIAKETEPPKNESEVQKRDRIKRLLTPGNEGDFFKYYFPRYCKADFAWFHKKAFKDVLKDKHPFTFLELPRETAKSVLVDIFIPANLLVTGWLTGMILASENETKACKLLGDLEAELRHNKRLIADFGDFGIIGSWSSGFFQTNQGIGFWAYGMGQNPSGARNGEKRPNLGVFDDADSKKKYYKNQDRVMEDVDWIRGEFAGCLATNENILIGANNRVCKNGLTAHIVGDLTEDDPKDPAINHIKAYWTEDPKTHKMLLPAQGGKPCWDYYTLEKAIQRIEKMGWRNAMRQLYHKHIEEGKQFKEEHLPWVNTIALHRYDALVTYCDPAFGQSGKACFRSVVLVGKTGNDYDVIKVWLRQIGDFARAHYDLSSSTRLKNNLVDLKDWVECNELQKVHVKRAYKDLNEELDVPWYPRYDDEKKADKIGRIESLETIAQHGHLRFNGAERKNRDMQELRDQFKGFPTGFIDGPDTVEGAISKLNKIARQKGTTTRTGNQSKNEGRSI